MGTEAFGCVRNTIRLRGGRYFDLADPKPDQFTLADIAGALSKICRFGGQVRDLYSVAEHCLHCLVIAITDGHPVEVRRAVLMHDAAEAFVGDMVKPLKVMLPAFGEIEKRVERAIGERFGIDFDLYRDAVREIDHAVLIAERRALFSADNVEWTGERDARVVRLRFNLWLPSQAEKWFLTTAAELGIEDPDDGGVIR